MQAASRIETRGWHWGFALRAARLCSPEAFVIREKARYGSQVEPSEVCNQPLAGRLKRDPGKRDSRDNPFSPL
jgi:hypothetical protein